MAQLSDIDGSADIDLCRTFWVSTHDPRALELVLVEPQPAVIDNERVRRHTAGQLELALGKPYAHADARGVGDLAQTNEIRLHRGGECEGALLSGEGELLEDDGILMEENRSSDVLKGEM